MFVPIHVNTASVYLNIMLIQSEVDVGSVKSDNVSWRDKQELSLLYVDRTDGNFLVSN